MSKILLTLLAFSYALSLSAQFKPTEIEIMRDKWGVPHIYAPTDPQVSYGLAWAHAEDDFKTIQQVLVATKQLMGRYQGKAGAPIDYVVGLLRCEQIVKDHLNEVSPDFIQVVKGYTAGLNAYAENHPKEVLVKKLFPITYEESFQAYVLQLALFDGADRVIRALYASQVPTGLKGTGSNAIAVRRHKTTGDEVFLANNAHQPLEGPVGWYEAHLISDEGWNMLGGLFPGGPTVFHGTNENLGWAHTVNYPDKIDVYQLEMHPTEEMRYKIDDKWYDLEKNKIKLKVKAFLGLTIGVKRDAYYSKYGPVIKNDSGYFAFHLAIFDDIRATEEWYRMNKAKNLTEFKKALEMTAIPGFNIVYADREDNIFYVSNGKIPLRDSTYYWRSTVPGNTSKTLPNGYHPFSDLPQMTNPESGYVFNTNNSPFNSTAKENNLNADDFDPTIGYAEGENNRSMRFMELMSKYDKLSYQDFKDIKFDVTLPDSLVYWINMNAVFRMNPEVAGEAADVVRIFQNWDKSAEVDKIGPAHAKLLFGHLSGRAAEITVEAVTPEQLVPSLQFVRSYLLENFGKVDVPLGEYQKLVRGDKELPLRGIPDVLASMTTVSHTNGRVKGISGESYILLARYPKEGLPIVETIHAYGNSSKPDSPHYTDQMENFTQLKLKPMTLDLEEVRKQAVKTYSPK
jgi:acyl-homoserine-lactone acylase